MRLVLLGLPFAAGALGCAPVPATPASAPPVVLVRLESKSDRAHLELEPDTNPTVPPTLVCDGSCAGRIWAGPYRLRADAPGASALDTQLTIARSSTLHVDFGSSTVRSVGLVVAIFSMALGAASLGESFRCLVGEEERAPNLCKVIVVGVALGMVGTSLGWIMFGAAKSRFTIRPGPAVSSGTGTWGARLGSVRDGGTVSWEMRF